MTPRRSSHGLLIAFEGIDGAGKSTVQTALARRWRRAGIRVAVGREPADPVLGRLAQSAGTKEPWASAILFTIDRLKARPIVERCLARSEVVLQDRSYYSTLAYQGSALSPREQGGLERLQRRVVIPPDRVVLLDLPVDDALARLGKRGTTRAPLERRRTLARVRHAYRRMSDRPGWIVVDARRPVRTLVAELDGTLRPLVARRRRTGKII